MTVEAQRRKRRATRIPNNVVHEIELFPIPDLHYPKLIGPQGLNGEHQLGGIAKCRVYQPADVIAERLCNYLGRKIQQRPNITK